MSLSSFLSFICGLGLFIFGMKMLSDSLQKFADYRADTLSDKITDKPFKSVAVGAAVTGIIQSSTATTLVVMGLVEAGIISIFQAMPAIMGANIGSTVTAQLLRTTDISSSNPFIKILNPTSLAPFFILLGALQQLFFKKREVLQSASLFMGCGILFFGMEQMEKSLQTSNTSDALQSLLLDTYNPLLLLFLGIIITVVMQSSSVSIGILQTLCATGSITFAFAVPLILGMNIGKCIPEFMVSFTMSRKVRIVIFADLIIYIFGSLIFAVIMIVLPEGIRNDFLSQTATKTSVANFHTVFNIATTIIFLPFCRKLIKLAEKIL